MTIQELDNKYYFHDSMITHVDYLSEAHRLEITMDFCYWAQEWYKEDDPELMELKLTFEGIKEYDGIIGDIDYYSIVDGDIKDGKYHLFIEDEFNQKTYEYYLEPSSADVEVIRTYNED